MTKEFKEMKTQKTALKWLLSNYGTVLDGNRREGKWAVYIEHNREMITVYGETLVEAVNNAARTMSS